MSILLGLATLLLAGAAMAAAISVVASVSGYVVDDNAEFWRGPAAPRTLLASFAPWLAGTVSAAMWINGEFVPSVAALLALIGGAFGGAALALAEHRYLHRQLARWRQVAHLADLLMLLASAAFVFALPPHSAEQFWSVLCGAGTARLSFVAGRGKFLR